MSRWPAMICAMWMAAVHDGIGDKDSSKVVRRIMQGASIGGSVRPLWTKRR